MTGTRFFKGWAYGNLGEENHNHKPVKTLSCQHLSITVTWAATETEDPKEHLSPAVPFTLDSHCTSMK